MPPALQDMGQNRCTYIDLYCERLAPGLFGEPANALSNAAFFAAAWLLAREARRLGAWRPDIVLLVALTVLVGLGSTVFHTLATTWAQCLRIRSRVRADADARPDRLAACLNCATMKRLSNRRSPYASILRRDRSRVVAREAAA